MGLPNVKRTPSTRAQRHALLNARALFFVASLAILARFAAATAVAVASVSVHALAPARLQSAVFAHARAVAARLIRPTPRARRAAFGALAVRAVRSRTR